MFGKTLWTSPLWTSPKSRRSTTRFGGAVDTGATAWVLASAALVLLMTPGVAFFYGGMVRRTNVIGIIMQSFVTLSIVAVIWVVVGFTLAFAPGGQFIGGLRWFGLSHVNGSVAAAPGVPVIVFALFQMM